MLPKEIKVIIFDLGSVLLKVDYQRTIDSFKKLGMTYPKHYFNVEYNDPILDKFEKGLLSENEFIKKIEMKISKVCSKKEIIDAWNAMIVEFPEENWLLLNELKTKYKLFLMSNTNIIHYNYCQNLVQKKFGVSSLDCIFDKAYYSFVVNMCKPDINFFKLILDEQKLITKEIIFFDDNKENIKTAEKLGIKSIRVQPNSSLTKYFDL
ncbi:MAG: HAD family phosphatase [Bacteroidales bacterium]|jgi:FMN phosphatase YigB (HAD superfamily)|nr:HAD family phosphatase [Bacteroidales bacterium]MDI9574819.1 HAD family phosphatase [Bacteroidota bacterium]MDD3755476.1 HAD family phosphatase [Bacteroidales bacterium]MDY0400805.1 HAD family phosphatase [Bacteroidales bacterium]HHW59181.1 HAD family phosphatase [Bacteroidales bacterium]